MPETLAYWNGQFIPLSKLAIAPHDVGFTYGMAVTDQCRTYCQQPFLLDEHLKRFITSCKLCRVPLAQSRMELKRIVLKLLKKNIHPSRQGEEWSIVLIATPGLAGSFLGLPGKAGDGSPHLGIYMFPIDKNRFRSWFEEGVEIRISRTIQQPDGHIHPLAAKHRSRLHWWLAQEEVRKKHPEAQVMLLNRNKGLTETGMGNLLLVQNGCIYTSPKDQVLPGITQQFARKICGMLQIPFREAPMNLSLQHISLAEEAIFTSTPVGIVGIRQIENRKFPCPGPLTVRLQQAMSSFVKRDIVAFFLEK